MLRFLKTTAVSFIRSIYKQLNVTQFFNLSKKSVFKSICIGELGQEDNILCSLKVYEPIYKELKVFGESDLKLKGGNRFSSIDVHSVTLHRGTYHPFDRFISAGSNHYFFEQTGVAVQPHATFKNVKIHSKKVEKVIIFAQSAGVANNYFHFMCDALPSLLLSMRNVRKHLVDEQYKVLIPSGLPDNCREIVELCCLHYGFEYFYAKPFQVVHFDHCVVTNYPTSLTFNFPKAENFSVNVVALRYTKYVLEKIISSVKYDAVEHFSGKLYLMRRAQKGSGGRHVINCAEISRFLKRKDFLVKDPSELSLAQGVEIFRSTKLLVLDGGAAIANLLFMPKSAKVVILVMSRGTDPSLFMSLCQTLKMDFIYVAGEVDPDQDKDSWQLNYHIPTVQVEEGLQHVCKT